MSDSLVKTFKEWPPVRRLRRRLSRNTNRLFGRPDAWVDLLRVARQTKPAAILDVGSYVGRTVQRFADEVRDLPIHAFEPTPQSARQLRINTNRFSNVTVHEHALADRTGERIFKLNQFNETNSLLDGAADLEHSPAAEFIRNVGQLTVQTTTLDAWCHQHVPIGDLLIKADVQGAEGLLLEGGVQIFKRGRVVGFYCEVPFMDLYEGQAGFATLHHMMTQRFGMSLWQLYRLSRARNGAAAWGDAMWVNEKGLRALRR